MPAHPANQLQKTQRPARKIHYSQLEKYTTEKKLDGSVCDNAPNRVLISNFQRIHPKTKIF